MINSLENLNLPLNVYWKDADGFHLNCNEQTALDTGLSSINDYIGLNIFDISHKDAARKIDLTDKNIMKSGRMAFVIESSSALYTANRLYLSVKIPIFDDAKNVAGLFGLSFKVDGTSDIQSNAIFAMPQIFDEDTIVRGLLSYHCSAHRDYYKLSPREQTILNYLCQGKTAKEIAKILSLSSRTVETHVENIKIKTHSKNKFELIQKFLIN